MKHLAPLLLIALLVNSCDEFFEEDHYAGITEIDLPTSTPYGLSYDGAYLWYSDRDDASLHKISGEGEILESIEIPGAKLSSFVFHNNFLYCINDSTVLHDTTISHYPFSCILRMNSLGEIMDSILIQGSVNPQKPEFTGITGIADSLYISTNMGYSSSIKKIDIGNKVVENLQFQYLNGLASQNDTIYAIDKSYVNNYRIVPLDSAYYSIISEGIDLTFNASDITFIGKTIWALDPDSRKIKKIN